MSDTVEVTKKVAGIPEKLPQPSRLVTLLQRDFNMTEIANFVNDGRRNSVHHWKKGTREPGWKNYVKLLYANGYKIVKDDKTV